MPRPTLPMPEDFPLYASCEGNLKLRKRYAVSGLTVERWRNEIGAKFTRKPKEQPVKLIRLRTHWQPQEQLEDLNEFGMSDIARSLDIRSFELEW